MNILIIDGKGGQLGGQIIKALHTALQNNISITAIGTNSIATSTMLKAGADHGATGENSVMVACQKADIIIGPIGIVIADSLVGEVTPNMALAASQSAATRILLPVSKCDNLIAGVSNISIAAIIEDTITKVKEIARNI